MPVLQNTFGEKSRTRNISYKFRQNFKHLHLKRNHKKSILFLHSASTIHLKSFAEVIFHSVNKRGQFHAHRGNVLQSIKGFAAHVVRRPAAAKHARTHTHIRARAHAHTHTHALQVLEFAFSIVHISYTHRTRAIVIINVSRFTNRTRRPGVVTEVSLNFMVCWEKGSSCVTQNLCGTQLPSHFNLCVTVILLPY
jgi:hypothetical protein